MKGTDADLDRIADTAITYALRRDSDAVATLLRPLVPAETDRLVRGLAARAADAITGCAADFGYTQQEAIALWQQARSLDAPTGSDLDHTADATITSAFHQTAPALPPLTRTATDHLCQLLATRTAEALNAWGTACALTPTETLILWEGTHLHIQLDPDD